MPDINFIRKKLHQYVEVADDKKVKALYALMEKEIETSGIDWSEELKGQVHERYEKYKTGDSSTISAQESQSRIQKILGEGE